MLSGIVQEDFHELQLIAEDRLQPLLISRGLWGMLGISGAATAVTAFAVSYSVYITHPLWPKVVQTATLLFVIQLLFTIFFTFPKIAYGFQKFQSVILCIITFKCSIDFFLVFFVICDEKSIPRSMVIIVFIVLITGIIFLILATLRGLNRVKKGEFKQGGRLLYNFQKREKISFKEALTYSAIGVMVPTLTKPILEKIGDSYLDIEAYIFLIAIVILQYVLALAWPEFFLLAHCKFKFKSFEIQMPYRPKPNSSIQSRSFTQSFQYWYNKPLAVLKSRAGWKFPEKAPFWMLIIVWIEFVFVLGTLSLFISLLGKENRAEFFDRSMVGEYMNNVVIVTITFSIIILIAVRMILGIIRRVLKK